MTQDTNKECECWDNHKNADVTESSCGCCATHRNTTWEEEFEFHFRPIFFRTYQDALTIKAFISKTLSKEREEAETKGADIAAQWYQDGRRDGRREVLDTLQNYGISAPTMESKILNHSQFENLLEAALTHQQKEV